MKLNERVEKIQQLQEIKLEWKHTARLGLRPTLHGDMISLSNEGDYVSLEEVQAALIYLADQFGLELKHATNKTKK